MAEAANTSLTTNFNVSPYYDDYDEINNYYRILYKPGYAVQARELTQSQTILQKQIDRFGKHVFKDGSIVIPGAFSIETSQGGTSPGSAIAYVKISDLDTSDNEVNIASLVKETIQGQTNYISAYIEDVLDGVESTDNTKTLYIRYLNTSNTNSDIKTFAPGEVLFNANIGTLRVLSTEPTGYASRFKIDEGVLFAKEHFISFPTQSIIIDRYNANPTARVGFYISEEIVNYSSDISLLDPALESSNYSAPGADRLKLSPTLQVRDYDDTELGPDFVTLFTIKDGVLQSYYERTQYNILKDELAKRTYDESGNYYVNGLDIHVREHYDNGVNYGRYPDGNSNLLFIGVEPGVGYVKGYEISAIDTVALSTDKGFDYDNVTTQLASATMGSYIIVEEVSGSMNFDIGQEITLYDTAQNAISSRNWSTASPSGSSIGTCKFMSAEYYSGTPGYDAKYYVYVTDIKMSSTTPFSSTKSLYVNNSTSDFFADVVLKSGKAVLEFVNEAPLLYYTGTEFTKTLRNKDDLNSIDTSFSFYKTESKSIPSSCTSFQITTSGQEIFPYGTTTLTGSDLREVIVTVEGSASLSMPGSVSGTSGSNTVSGVANPYFTRLNVGDKVEISGVTGTYYITSITDDSTMTVTPALAGSPSSASYTKVYKTGDHIDMSKIGSDSGATRTISATSTSMVFDLKETFGSGLSVTVTYRLNRTSAREIKKSLRTGRYVKINCGTAGTSGPFDLGFSDIYSVTKIIRKSGSAPTSLTDGTDVTRYFTVDAGQKDAYYDHGTITPRGVTLTSSDYLLVELSYFEPDLTTGVGYFSVDSYPINDDTPSSSEITTAQIPIYKSPTSKKEYNLRNYLDFRPIKTNTATDTTTIASATTNPTISSTFRYTGSGLRLPVPSSEINFDYSYYLARKDVVVVDKDSTFSIIRGVPGVFPITPQIPDNLMALSVIGITPFPSISPAYSQVLKRPDLAVRSRKISNVRFTMRDIGVLKQRIVNLEYYASLSLLEKSALDLRILDGNGIDRFKNGIFTDSFNNHLLGATYNPDYRIVVDPREKSLRPLYTMDSTYYDYLSGTNITKNLDLLTLSYTEVLEYSQPRVTTFRNIERTSYLFYGNLELVPDTDVWVDTTYRPDEAITIGADDEDIAEISGGLTTEWEAWQQYVTGYKVIRNDNNQIIGTYSTLDQATAAANQYRNQTAVTIETLYNNTRTGTEQFLQEITDTQSLGNSVKNVSLIPYIRPQTIYVLGRGLKPYTKLYTFFDDVDVSDYVKPLGSNALLAKNYIATTIDRDNPALVPLIDGAGAEGDPLIVAADGTIYFALRLAPEKKFRVGTRALIVTDSPTLTEEDQSTAARGFFVANGLQQELQETILTTRQVIPLEREVNESYNSSSNQVLPQNPPRRSCFDPNALVTMEDGSKKRIADVRIGDRVRSGNNVDVNNVLDIEAPTLENRKMFAFNNNWAFVSEEHPIMTDKGWAAFDPDSWAVEDEFVGKLAKIEVGTKILKADGSYETVEHITAKSMEKDYVIYNLMLDGDHTYIVEDYVVHNKKSCLAYSFLAKAPNGEEGYFLTAIDVFIKAKHPTLGIWFEIREMNSAGGITRNQVPFSEVWFKSSEVPISPDGRTNPLKVQFKAPIFLLNNVQYAFVIHTENINPDYYIWISRIGQTDINTNQPHTSRPLTGTFYTTNNNLNWDIVPDIDLTCNFYRANFTPNIGTGYIGNKPIEKFVLANVSNSLASNVGSTFVAGRLTLVSANGIIYPGDTIYGRTSAAIANVSWAESGTGTYALSNNSGFISGEPVNLYNPSTFNGDLTTGYNCSATILTTSNASAILSKVNSTANETTATFVYTNGYFKPNDIISVVDNYGYRANIASIQNFRFSTVSFEPAFLNFAASSIEFKMSTYSNTSILGSYAPISPKETYYFNTERAIYSRSNEVSNFSSDRTNKVQFQMRSTSRYVSPVLDLGRTQTIFIDNIINTDVTGENSKSGGNMFNRYISKTVTLADGQDAEDLQVVLTAYRPSTAADVRVWVKLLNGEDSESLDDKSWIEIEKTPESSLLFSSLTDRNDFKEYVFKIPSSYMTGDNGEFQYVNNQGITLTGFKYFTVKIGLTASNSAIVPRVADLRCIALQI